MGDQYQPGNGSATPRGHARAVLRQVADDRDAVSTPAVGEVHLWVAALDDELPDREALRAKLSPDEVARFERYGHPGAKSQFAQARLALRRVLGRYLRCDANAVSFRYTTDGKPELDGSHRTERIEFNVSHSAGWAVIAVADTLVGVDIETGRPPETAIRLVERFFAQEELEQYQRLSEELRPEAFLRGWTCKEAILKGVGCGTRGLEGCVVDLDPRERPRVRALRGAVASRGTSWGLGCWKVAEGVNAAVAVQGWDGVTIPPEARNHLQKKTRGGSI